MSMKKNLLIAAIAITALASCSSNDYMGDQSPQGSIGTNGAIGFNLNIPVPTRGTGADAATALGNQFIVWGEKNETAAAPATGNFVFPDYKVAYTANTAYTTTSNTKDWDYVGLSWTTAEAANITEATTAVTTNVQTIKYWDYAATSYTFTAVSAKPADISDGKVKINKLTSGTTVYDKGYEVTVTDEADLASLYFADRVNIAQSNDKDRTAANKYGGNVQFTFRNALSQVRVGMYETIPGYQVKVTKFYYDADATTDAAKPAFSEMTDESTTNFVANVPSTATGVAGKFTVKYYDNTVASIENHPTISFTPTNATDSKQYITLGDQIAAATKLGETSPQATFDKTSGAFTSIFPQETNNKNLKLKIDYQLSNTVTGETINITGKTAEIPAQYLQWKPNFKYTYLFKITDDELYPITFDAVTIEAEDGTAEYITTVSEPSITTFGVKSNVYSKEKDEYETGTDIYATFVKGTAVQTPSLSESTKTNYVQIYQVTTSDATNFPITEASVAESIKHPTDNKITATNITNYNTDETYFTGNVKPAVVDKVPAEDGKTKTIKAVKLTGVKTNIYAIEIITYDPVTLTAGDELNGYYSVSSEVYSLETSGTYSSGTYYKQVKTYKIIKVVAAPEP